MGVLRAALSDPTDQVLFKSEKILKPYNFEVYFECDGSTAKSALHLENYAEVPNSKIHTWMLLEKRDLSDAPRMVANPSQPRAGRKREKRFDSMTSDYAKKK